MILIIVSVVGFFSRGRVFASNSATSLPLVRREGWILNQRAVFGLAV